MHSSRVPFGIVLSFAIIVLTRNAEAQLPTAQVATGGAHDTADGADAAQAPKDTSATSPEMPNFPDDAADQPYTNSIVSAQDTLPEWSLELSFTGSRSPDSALQKTWTTEATRTWHLGDWEPSVAAGWMHSAQSGEDSTLWHLGGGLDWNFSEIFSVGAAVDWTPVRGQKDDASAHLGISGSDQVLDPLGVDGAFSGTWDRIGRGNLEAGLGISPDFGWTDGRIGATWDRQYQAYVDASGSTRSEYLNIWGWSARWAVHLGHWSTGPTWSGDYWKVDASSAVAATKGKTGRLLGKTRKIPASGKAIDQEFLWNLTWKPLSGIAFSVDAFHTTGGETIKAKAGATAVQKRTFAIWNQAADLPQESSGGRATISVSW